MKKIFLILVLVNCSLTISTRFISANPNYKNGRCICRNGCPDPISPCAPAHGSCNIGNNSTVIPNDQCSNGLVNVYIGAGASCGGSNPTCYNCLQCQKGSLEITAEVCAQKNQKYIEYSYQNVSASISCGECVPFASCEEAYGNDGYKVTTTSCNNGQKLMTKTYTDVSGKTTTCGKCENISFANCEEAYGNDGYKVTTTSCNNGQKLMTKTYTDVSGKTTTCGKCENDQSACQCLDGYGTEKCTDQIASSYKRACDNAVCYKCSSCPEPVCDETQGYFNDENKCKGKTTVNGQIFQYVCTKNSVSVKCNGGQKTTSCWKRNSCDELETTVCYEKDADCITENTVTTIKVFSYNGYKCREDTTTEHYCGTCCTGIAAPWFQTVNGNLFAQNSIRGKVGYDDPNDPKNQPNHELTLDKNEDFVNAYFARQRGDFQTQIIGNSSGIPLVYFGKVDNEDGALTQRTIPNTAVVGTAGYSALRPEKFRYFQELLHYESLGYCNSYHKGGSDINGIKVCKENNAQMLTSNYIIAAGEKQVVFIDGNLIIDLPKTDKISVAEGGFLAFIVSGDIIFKSSLGEEIINSKDYTLNISLIAEPDKGDYDGYNQKAQIEGVFIADGQIKFEGSTVNNAFTNKPCDRKLTVAGTYVGWNGIVMSRTFSGCSNHTIKYYDEKGMEVAYKDYYTNSKGRVVVDYPDYNEFNPVITFVYRPDFTANTPAWMRNVVRVTQEVN